MSPFPWVQSLQNHKEQNGMSGRSGKYGDGYIEPCYFVWQKDLICVIYLRMELQLTSTSTQMESFVALNTFYIAFL